jgi:hypothetical protein
MEQERIRKATTEAENKIKAVDATLREWEELLGIALRFATGCSAAYREAGEQARRVST